MSFVRRCFLPFLLLLTACGAEDPISALPNLATETVAVPTVVEQSTVTPAAPTATAELAPTTPAAPTATAELAPTATTLPSPSSASSRFQSYTYRVINRYPHDPSAFTQGLVYAGNDTFYEGTGLHGTSNIRRVTLATGEAEILYELNSSYFGEGIVVWQDWLIQLTFQEGVAFVYDTSSFQPVGFFNYESEGWGLTHDGMRLIMSNGSANLLFRDPTTFEETGRIAVSDQNGPVNRLNELEYIEGLVWANIWQSDRIVMIDPATGIVVGDVDMSGLLSEEEALRVDVLNGIAYDEQTGRIWVTGKYWPWLFEIELVPLE